MLQFCAINIGGRFVTNWEKYRRYITVLFAPASLVRLSLRSTARLRHDAEPDWYDLSPELFLAVVRSST
jgi:hypothetical protein